MKMKYFLKLIEFIQKSEIDAFILNQSKFTENLYKQIGDLNSNIQKILNENKVQMLSLNRVQNELNNYKSSSNNTKRQLRESISSAQNRKWYEQRRREEQRRYEQQQQQCTLI